MRMTHFVKDTTTISKSEYSILNIGSVCVTLTGGICVSLPRGICVSLPPCVVCVILLGGICVSLPGGMCKSLTLGICFVLCVSQIRFGLVGLEAINAISDVVYRSPPHPPRGGKIF